jgi:hypothetical protein
MSDRRYNAKLILPDGTEKPSLIVYYPPTLTGEEVEDIGRQILAVFTGRVLSDVEDEEGRGTTTEDMLDAGLLDSDGVAASDEARRATTRAEVLSDVDPVVLECWKLQGRKVGAMLREATSAVVEAHEALREIADDYADRHDLTSPSTNPGIKSVIQQARAVLRGDGVDSGDGRKS